MAEIQEIGELIAPRVFGKLYKDLIFYLPGERTKKEDSELFQCCAMAQTIRLNAMKSIQLRFPGVSHDWPAILLVCEEIIDQPGKLEQQKKTLREKGFL